MAVSAKEQKSAGIFLSHSREDLEVVVPLEKALQKLGLDVWRDAREIRPGQQLSEEIQAGIRRAQALVVLITEASLGSEWVQYEFGFAVGAQIPVIPIKAPDVRVPYPMAGVLYIDYTNAKKTAEMVHDAIRGYYSQKRLARTTTQTTDPRLLARFQEFNGKLIRSKSGGLVIDLWIEAAPAKTRQVHFEILDLSFSDRTWTVSRKKSTSAETRQFLTDDLRSRGDVELWVRGVVSSNQDWLIRTTLYEALKNYYGDKSVSQEVAVGLEQIRKN